MVGESFVSDAPVCRLGEVVIVGGGCYGSFYAGQLERARQRGKASFRRLTVVDRDPSCRFRRELGKDESRRLVVSDWSSFFDRYLAERAAAPAGPDEPPDAIVPSPLMPHLMAEWLLRRARERWPGRAVDLAPVPVGPGTPYDATGPDGTRYLSFADWLCPVHCIEPAVCPIIRAPRTWEMGEALEELVRRLGRSGTVAGPVAFVCRHRVHGVGMFDVAAVLAGDAAVAEAGRPGLPIEVLVGTISACHGAAGLLRLGRA